MKKLIIFLLLWSASLAAQSTTPNYGFQLPDFNDPNWNVANNQNWFSLDNILSGFQLGSPNGLQCKPLSAFSPPLAGAATLVCVSDALPGSNPCVSGGSGSLAVGLNGVYSCAGNSGPGGGVLDPGANGIMFRTAPNVTQPATFLDFANLLTGTHNSSFYARGDGTWSAPPGSGVTSSANSPGPCAYYFGAAPSTQVQGDPNCTTDGAGNMNFNSVAAAIISATGGGANGPIIPNAGGGTTAGLIAKLVAGQALTATTSDTAVPVAVVMPTVTAGSGAVCGPGTSGSSCLAYSGQVNVTVDAGGATANHFVTASTSTAGRGHDAGATLPSGPVCIVGMFTASGAANASVAMDAFPQCYPVGSGTGVADPGGNGLMARTSNNVSVARTITAGTDMAAVTNGDGVAGNPIVAVDTTKVWDTTDTIGPTTNKTLDAEGSGNVLSRPFYAEFLPGCNNNVANPGAFNVPTSGSPTFSCFGTTTTQGAIDFPDATITAVSAQFVLPDGWVSSSSVDIKIGWFANTNSVTAPDFSVAIGCAGITDLVSVGPPAYNTASVVATAYTGTANQRQVTNITGISTTSFCGAGKLMYVRIQRIGTDVSDTLAAPAEVTDVRLKARATF